MKTNHTLAAEDFNRYLLAEYQNIAEAHFRTIAAISSFFRYYLLITGLPVTLIGVLIGFSPKEDLPRIFSSLSTLTSGLFFVISIVGFLVLLYVINLRMDALLYARTVNGIRKYFYDRSEIDIDAKLRTRVLPQSPFLPGYTEGRYFLPVVISFGCFNAFYLVLFVTSASNQSSIIELVAYISLKIQPVAWLVAVLNEIPLLAWLGAIFLVYVSVHIAAWLAYSRYREHAYLKSYVLGVDIDGVLNRHRHHFCDLLKEITGKTLDPDKITTIPLHEDPSLGVSREDEKQVFNDIRYWIKMPRLDDAPDNLRKLRNMFKLKIYLFTYRPWPSDEKPPGAAYKKWIACASECLKDKPLPSQGPLRTLRSVAYKIPYLNLARLKYGIWRFALEPVDVMTRCWLSENGIEYDKLIIERGSEDVSDPQGEFRNRFYISRKQKLRFFAEDDAEKASKLAYICDIVFLLKQPYNEDKDIPGNVVRVNTWEDIYKWIRKIS